MYSDMNDLWAREDIDAVLIATGDRWHTLLSIMTARSGKDVYCEKPCSMTVQESRALADAYQRNCYERWSSLRRAPDADLGLVSKQLERPIMADGFFFLPRGPDPEGKWWLWRYSFAPGKADPIFQLPGTPGIGLSVSPDGETILFTHESERSSDLMLVQNFR